MKRFLTLILLLLCASGQAASLLSVQAATQTYSFIATTTADSVPTPRYAIRGTTDTYYTPLEASPASAGPRISIGGVTYGLASRTPAIGGNISLVRDASGTWVCHTFLTSGDFEVIDPAGIATCEYLIIAGGGGSHFGNYDPGGGAGGLLHNVASGSPITLPADTYPAVVGAGGAVAARGGDSSFFSLTSTGGGPGNANADASTRNGGSGGGGGASFFDGGVGVSGQGKNGGKGGSAGAGGGGGAGADGSNNRGAGGIGLAVPITGSSVYYAGGGNAYNVLTAPSGGTAYLANGRANTGAGAGGAASVGRTGGSGIVVIRYLIEE
jgi:hypothetical protein